MAPPDRMIFASATDWATSSKVRSYPLILSSAMATSISSSGKPFRETWEIPSIRNRSSSISWAYFFRIRSGISSPVTINEIAGRVGNTDSMTGGSMVLGKEGILSTAFFTSSKMTLMSKSDRVSMMIEALFSWETELTRSIPDIPLRLRSIFSTIPSSTSSGAAPG